MSLFKMLKRNAEIAPLRSVPTIVTAHIFCACQGSRAQRERYAQHAQHGQVFRFRLV